VRVLGLKPLTFPSAQSFTRPERRKSPICSAMESVSHVAPHKSRAKARCATRLSSPSQICHRCRAAVRRACCARQSCAASGWRVAPRQGDPRGRLGVSGYRQGRQSRLMARGSLRLMSKRCGMAACELDDNSACSIGALAPLACTGLDALDDQPPRSRSGAAG
jgi:hypothetical protein